MFKVATVAIGITVFKKKKSWSYQKIEFLTLFKLLPVK